MEFDFGAAYLTNKSPNGYATDLGYDMKRMRCRAESGYILDGCVPLGSTCQTIVLR